MIKAILLLVLILISTFAGYLAGSGYGEPVNTSIYWGQYKKGLTEGFNNGFISGMDYAAGQYTAILNKPIPEKANWYFMRGYESIKYNKTTPNINPYTTNVTT